jgi:hypothetical protein
MTHTLYFYFKVSLLMMMMSSSSLLLYQNKATGATSEQFNAAFFDIASAKSKLYRKNPPNPITEHQ